MLNRTSLKRIFIVLSNSAQLSSELRRKADMSRSIYKKTKITATV